MHFGKVVGTVWATQKDEKLENLKFLLLEQLGSRGEPSSSYVVAVDAVGAGQGEVVLFATGSAARQTRNTDGRPADAVVMAIVDSWDIEGEIVFRKDADVEATAGTGDR